LYNVLEFVSIRLLEKQLSFAGHCIRSKQLISEFLLWDHTKLVNCKCAKKGASKFLLKTATESDRKSGWASH
jgi:hypothetical protein